MKAVNLVFALKPHRGEVWRLYRTREGLALADGEERVVTEIADADVGLRIRFPSFWASVRYLTILDDSGKPLCFEPKAKAVAHVRQLVEDCLYRNPEEAAAAMRKKAWRDLGIGGGSFVLGVIITVASFLAAAPGGTFLVTTGLLGVGIAEIIRGLYWWGKATQLESSAEEAD